MAYATLSAGASILSTLREWNRYTVYNYRVIYCMQLIARQPINAKHPQNIVIRSESVDSYLTYFQVKYVRRTCLLDTFTLLRMKLQYIWSVITGFLI